MEEITDFSGWLSGIRPKLVRLAISILRDRSAAEDIVQDTSVKIWEAHRQGGIRKLSAYAGRAVWINALKYRARRKHWLPLEAEELEKIGISELSGRDQTEPELSPWELEEALSGLPPIQQSVLRLRYYGNFSLKEIGLRLGISMNTAASSSRYALEKLRETFHEKDKSKF